MPKVFVIADTEALAAKAQPLFRKNWNEFEPRPAVLFIDVRTGYVDVGTDLNSPGASQEVYDHLVQTVTVSPTIRGAALAKMMNSRKLKALAQAVIDGTSVERDATQCRLVGNTSDSAKAAMHDLEVMFFAALPKKEQALLMEKAINGFRQQRDVALWPMQAMYPSDLSVVVHIVKSRDNNYTCTVGFPDLDSAGIFMQIGFVEGWAPPDCVELELRGVPVDFSIPIPLPEPSPIYKVKIKGPLKKEPRMWTLRGDKINRTWN